MEVRTKRSALLQELSQILETQVTEETVLDEAASWDSMSVVMTVAAIDAICGTPVDGMALADCKTALDVLVLAGLGEKQEIGPGDVGNLNDVLSL